MVKTGIVSVTFRKKTPEEIIALCVKAKLSAIEWGSDVHVPAGDISLAESICEKTAAAGLDVASYGSYYKLGEGDDFKKYLDTAVALRAPNIRVWAGRIGSESATDADWEIMIEDAENISALAEAKSITVSLEYHANTLTDTLGSTLRLLNSARTTNLYTYWQPPLTVAPEEQLPQLEKLLQSGRVSNIHVFQRDGKGAKVLLENGFAAWRKYLSAIKRANKSSYALLEFVMDDDDEVFLKDSEVLNKLVCE